MWKHQHSDSVKVLHDSDALSSLRRYFAVMKDEKPAKFVVAKKIEAEFEPSDTADELWKQHESLTHEFEEIQQDIDAEKPNVRKMKEPRISYLDLKIEIARRILRKCNLCSRTCGVNRHRGKTGYCGCGANVVVSSIFPHMGEEPELVPSGTIFTMGCTMRCKHCQNWTISQWAEEGQTYTPFQLSAEIERLHAEGCRNANLVGGEPTPWLHQWFATFKQVNTNIPVVWNSNAYYSQETANLLAGFADIYLLDFKYGPSRCAERISDAPNYWNVCTRNHLHAKKHGEIITRLLILPDHVECCTKPIADWIGKNLGTNTRVNLMFQYRPEWRANEVPELSRTLGHEEMKRASRIVEQAKLTNSVA